MKKYICWSILCFTGIFNAHGQSNITMGDMNNDGELTVADVTTLAETIIGGKPVRRIAVASNPYETDNNTIVGTWSGISGSVTFNEDGTTDYKDGYSYEYFPSQCLIILYDSNMAATECLEVLKLAKSELVLSNNSMTKFYTYNDRIKTLHTAEGTYYEDSNGHKFVDLGLNSGTLWATCNIGAELPDECGSYFAWGETFPKESYTWTNYFDSHDGNTFSKYYKGDINGTTGKTTLDLEDDAAYVNWGKGWCIPSRAQWSELLYNSEQRWDSSSNGWLFIGPNGNSIVLPYTGYYQENTIKSKSTYADYWSNEVNRTNRVAEIIEAEKREGVSLSTSFRYFGLPVRAVRAK